MSALKSIRENTAHLIACVKSEDIAVLLL